MGYPFRRNILLNEKQKHSHQIKHEMGPFSQQLACSSVVLVSDFIYVIVAFLQMLGKQIAFYKRFSCQT